MLIALLTLIAAAPTVSDAKAHRDAAHAAFEIAEYDRAIQEFKRAYELEPDARLFYNLGLAHLKKHELAPSRTDVVQARDYFKRFLAFVKDDPKSEQLRHLAYGYVARLEAELSTPEPAPPPPPKIVEVQVPAPPPLVDHTTSFVIMGASGVMAVIAVVTGILAVRASNDAFASAYGGDLIAADASSTRARTFALATDVLLVGGLLAGASGLILYFVEEP